MQHPNMGEKGLLCYYPLDSLNVGKHQLEVVKLRGYKDKEKGIDTLTISIPFIYMGEN